MGSMHTELALPNAPEQDNHWHRRLVPALEAAGWRIAWFIVLLKVLLAL